MPALPSTLASPFTKRLPVRGMPLLRSDAPPNPATAAVMVDDRRTVKLHVQSLTDADLAKVATFLRIGRERLNCDWKIVFDGELDVLMLGSDEATTVRGMLDSPMATLHVVDSNPVCQRNPHDHLVRPLQYEAFIDALSDLEHRFGASGSVATAPTRASAPALAPSPAASHPDFAPARNQAAPPPGAQLRLRRWPAHALLQGDRDRMRLASFLLSVRHVDLDELAQLSNVNKPECEAFVAELMAADLLDVTPGRSPRPASKSGALIAAASPQRPKSTQPLDEGLFGKIRRGLGLTWRR